MKQVNLKLSKHTNGGVKELLHISLPLMISSFACLLMIFIDRSFLSHYSVNALNAAVNAGTLSWAFLGSLGMVAAMSEVFVAQYNGAGIQKEIGRPVWQMIWFSLFTFLLFIPFAFYLGTWMYAGTEHAALKIDYFKYLMLFGPSYPIMTALAGFYIGRGKTRLLIVIAVVANIINFFADWILIWGIKGIVPEMGIAGAAIGTSLGSIFEVAILFWLFIRKKNRDSFGTGNWQFNMAVFKKCFIVGLPQGAFYFLEVIGWVVFYFMMTKLSENHITISAICQSIAILLSFFYDGLSRGVTALAGNFIGARQYHLTFKLLKSGFKLQLIFFFGISLLFFCDLPTVINYLFPGHFEGTSFWLTAGNDVHEALQICLFFCFVYLFFEGMRWVLSGLLTAAGDTVFLLIVSTLSVWIFLLLPVYLIVVKYKMSIQIAWLLTAIYAALLNLIYLIRFHKGKWQRINLLPDEESDETI